jgi:hypothetical protein
VIITYGTGLRQHRHNRHVSFQLEFSRRPHHPLHRDRLAAVLDDVDRHRGIHEQALREPLFDLLLERAGGLPRGSDAADVGTIDRAVAVHRHAGAGRIGLVEHRHVQHVLHADDVVRLGGRRGLRAA